MIVVRFVITGMFGADQHGTSYPSIDAMWEAELEGSSKFKVNNPIGSRKRWYQLGGQYWDSTPADYNGVMGGFANLSQIDIDFSNTFIQSLRSMMPEFKLGSVLDCGAGVGRIAKDFLRHLFPTMDVVDQCQRYIQKAREILKGDNVRHFYVQGLQEFSFEERYDCIWVQWVLLYLSDEDSIAFLRRARESLNEGGVIVVKDNAEQRGFFVDKKDCSVIRSHQLWKRLFAEAGLEVVKEDIQPDWPNDMYDLRIYALV